MLVRERVPGRIDAIEATIVRPGFSTHLRQDRGVGQRPLAPKFLHDQRRPGLISSEETWETHWRNESINPVSCEAQRKEERDPERVSGGLSAVGARHLLLGKTSDWEGLRLLHSPAEGFRRRKGCESRTASADVPLARGSDLGGKRSRKAPAVYAGCHCDHVDKKRTPSERGSEQAEENERRSERLKEKKKLRRKKISEERQSVRYERQYDSGRCKKSSKQREQNICSRNKVETQPKKCGKKPRRSESDNDVSKFSSQGHENGNDGEGALWKSRLRERGKKRVLEDFCFESDFENYASEERVVKRKVHKARVLKHKVEKSDELLVGSAEQASEEPEVFVIGTWVRKHRRNFRTRTRFPKRPVLAGGEPQLANAPSGNEGLMAPPADHCLSGSMEILHDVVCGGAAVNKHVDELVNFPLENGLPEAVHEHETIVTERPSRANFHTKGRIKLVDGTTSQSEVNINHRAIIETQGMCVDNVTQLHLSNGHSEAVNGDVHFMQEEEVHLELHLCFEENPQQCMNGELKPKQNMNLPGVVTPLCEPELILPVNTQGDVGCLTPLYPLIENESPSSGGEGRSRSSKPSKEDVPEPGEHNEEQALDCCPESVTEDSEEQIAGRRGVDMFESGAEDSPGNRVEDFDVLAKYRVAVKPRKGESCKGGPKAEEVEVASVIDKDLQRIKDCDSDIRESSSKVIMGSMAATVVEENVAEICAGASHVANLEQILLEYVSNKTDISTCALKEETCCGEAVIIEGATITQKKIDASCLPNSILHGEINEPFGHDTKKVVVSEGLKCGLCNGSGDGKFSGGLLLVRKNKGGDIPQDEMVKDESIVKEGSKLQVEKGWLGRLLGPLSERAGVAGAWVHEECAVWSPEVYFAGVGRLKNVKAAIRRGRLLKCSRCGHPGATIGCRVDRCPQNYHLPCAHFDGCSFDHKKYLVACSEHLHLFPSRYRRFLDRGIETHMVGSVYSKEISKLHRGNFRRIMIERKAAASSLRLKDLEEEDKFLEKSGEDDEFLRRERKRLQRDLARIVPIKLGGSKSENPEGGIPDGWNSVAGLENVVECLKEMVILPLLYPKAFDCLGILPPRGVLLHGHSGTGKTLVVRALAGACARGSQKISYFARKGADCLGKYVGDAERQLRLLFQVAQQHQPSIIFFDEIDGLAPSRSRDGQDQTHSSVVSTLLALMDGLSSRGSVIVIGATNRPDSLDPALRRPGRFDREIYFPLPSAADRAAILALHTRFWKPCPSTDVLSAVARSTRGFAGADLQALCADVAMKALKRVSPLHQFMKSAEIREAGGNLPPLPSIKVKAADWATALKEAPPPCSMRMACAALSYVPGSPLPWYLVPALLPTIVEVLLYLHLDARVVMPPALSKEVSSIALEVKSFVEGNADNAVCREPKSTQPNLPVHWLSAIQMCAYSPLKLCSFMEEGLTAAGLVSRRSWHHSSYLEHKKASGAEVMGKYPLNVDINGLDLKSSSNALGGWRSGQARILLAGSAKGGQKLVAASILTGFEGFFETRMLSLPTMLHEGDGDVIQGLIRILGSAKYSTPCLLFIPHIESWATTKEFIAEPRNALDGSCTSSNLSPNHGPQVSSAGKRGQGDLGQLKFWNATSSAWNIFMQHMTYLPPDAAVMVLATSEVCPDDLPLKVVDFFSSGSKKSVNRVVSRIQSVPAVLVQLPSLKESMIIINRASQDIASSMVEKLLRHLNHLERTSALKAGQSSSLIAIPVPCLATVATEEEAAELLAEVSQETNNVLVAGDVEKSENLEQVPSIVNNSFDSSNCTQKSVEDGTSSGGIHPKLGSFQRNLSIPCSSQQKILQNAISQFGHLLLNQAQFSELWSVTARLKGGPCVNPKDFMQGCSDHGLLYFQRLRDKNILTDKKSFEGTGERKDDKSAHPSIIHGIVAIALKAKGGFYVTPKDLALDIDLVLKLLRKRIKLKVENGKDPLLYVPLLAKASSLEDFLSSWLYQNQRLESTSTVLSSKLDTPGVFDRQTLSHCEVFTEHETLTWLPFQSLESKETLTKGDDRSKKTCCKQKDCECVDEDAPMTTESICKQGEDTAIEYLVLNARDSGNETIGKEEDAQVSLVRSLADVNAARTVQLEHDLPSGDLDGKSTVTILVSKPENVKEGKVVIGSTSSREGHRHEGAVGPDLEQFTSQKSDVQVKAESVAHLEHAIKNVISVAWGNYTTNSIEVLHEVIAGSAATIRVVYDDLLNKVDWIAISKVKGHTGGCLCLEAWTQTTQYSGQLGDRQALKPTCSSKELSEVLYGKCPTSIISSDQWNLNSSSKSMCGGHTRSQGEIQHLPESIYYEVHRELCLCPAIKAVQELATKSTMKAINQFIL